MIKLLEFFKKNFNIELLKYSCQIVIRKSYSYVEPGGICLPTAIYAKEYEFEAEGYLTGSEVIVPPSYGSIFLKGWTVYGFMPTQASIRFTLQDGPEDRELKTILGITWL